MKPITQLSVGIAIAAAVFTAPGQTTNVILQTDFDGDAGMGNGGGCGGWAGFGSDQGGASLPYTAAVVAGIGVGGTSAAEIIGDFSDLATDPIWQDAQDYVYYDLNLTTSFSTPITPLVPVTDVTQLTNLVLTANLQVSGELPGQYGTSVYISQVQFLDASGAVLFDFTGYGAWAPTTGFANLYAPLGGLTFAAPGPPAYGDAQNPLTDFTNAAVLASIVAFNVQFQLNANDVVGTLGNDLMPVFGFTSAAGLVADNVMLVQIVNTNTNTTPPPPPMPTVEEVIWQANFDNTFPSYDYGYHDRDGTDTASGNCALNPTGGVGGSASAEYTLDLSSWSGNPPVSYSGFGIGANEQPLSVAPLSSEVTTYKVYMSAKVGGTIAGVTSIPGKVDLSFFAPSVGQVMDLTRPLTLSNTWQSFVFSNLQVNSYPAGAQGLFNLHYASVNQSEVQVSASGNPDVGAWFGYATDATIDIDNIQVVQLIPGLAPLSIVQASGQTSIVWTDPATGGTAKLQRATNVAGPYLDVVGASSAAAASPYTVPPGSPPQFFQTVWVP